MQVVMGGDTEFNGLIYGDKSPQTLQFLQSQVSGQFSSTLTDVGREIYSNIGSLFERFNGTQAMQLVRSARRKLKGIFEQDVIRPLWDLLDIQQATLTMQRWVMAHPSIRMLYNAQRCDGYNGSYVDMQPGAFGARHYDYRRVMDGVMGSDEAGEDTLTYYYDEDHPDDVQLTAAQRGEILTTWDAISYYLEKTNSDPTSKYGCDL